MISEIYQITRVLARYDWHILFTPITSLHWSGKRHRKSQCWGVYMSGTAACAAQMGISFFQSSGTVPLWADAACTIFSSSTGVVTNQNTDRIFLRKASDSSILVKDAINRAVNSICVIIGCCLPAAEEDRACRISSLRLVTRKLTPTWRPFWAVFQQQTGSISLNWLFVSMILVRIATSTEWVSRHHFILPTN